MGLGRLHRLKKINDMEKHTINITEINGQYAVTIRTTAEDGMSVNERLRLTPEQLAEVVEKIKSFT